MEKFYPYMDDALEDEISKRFDRACWVNNLRLDDLDLTSSQVPVTPMVEFHREMYPHKDNIEGWIDKCRQHVGSRAIVLYDLETPERLAACCLLKPPTGKDTDGEAEKFIRGAQDRLGIPVKNRIYCNSLAVVPELRGSGIAPGITWTARNLTRHPEGTIYLSRIHPENQASMAAAARTGRASTGIYDPETKKVVWWGIIPSTN
jgi:hypothetical protein